MIKLSDRTLGLLHDELNGSGMQQGVAEKNLAPSHFSPALQSSLAEDCRVDGTGAIVTDQLAAVVAQVVQLVKGGPPKAEPPKPATPPAPHPANVPPPVHAPSPSPAATAPPK